MSFVYSSEFRSLDIEIEAVESDIRHLFKKDTMFSEAKDLISLYRYGVITDIRTIEKETFDDHQLTESVNELKCDSLHVIIYSSIEILSIGEYNSIKNFISDRVLSTNRAVSIIISVFDTSMQSISLVLLDSTKMDNADLGNSCRWIDIPDSLTNQKGLDGADNSINELLIAMLSTPQEKYTFSWIQRCLHWGENRTIKTVQQASLMGLLEISGSRNPIIRLIKV